MVEVRVKACSKQELKSENIYNLQFLPFQTDEMFPYSLAAADIGVVVLDEITSKGSVPSKSYNLMSYGIPSLYIAALDSELNNYVKKYHHGRCYGFNQLDEIKAFILKLKLDKMYYENLAQNSLEASNNFKRTNAKSIVASYV